jgi:CheY-like chemotaxis protein
MAKSGHAPVLWRWDVILSERTEELKALLVEDDPAVAAAYKYKLERDGYRVSVATAREAVLAALEEAPDLIFLNVMLPGPDAALVLDLLRADEGTRHLPVVVLTDHDEVDLRRHGFALDGRDHVINTSALADLSGARRPWPGLAVLPGGQAPEGSAVPAFLGAEGFGE